jgi:hypothetical protein
MKPTIGLLLAVTTFCFYPIKAQHCAWDFKKIVIVSVKTATYDHVIQDLTLKLVDAYGNCLPTYADTCLRFVRNVPGTTNKNHSVTQDDLKNRHGSFPFAGQNYIMILTGRQLEGGSFFVRIEDNDGQMNGGYFETKTVAIEKRNLISLCNRIGGCPWYRTDCVTENTIVVKLTQNPVSGKAVR